MWKRIKIWWLKGRLKSAYMNMLDYGNDFSCGHNMAKTISPKYYAMCEKIYRISVKLNKLDPDCPIVSF